MASDLLYSWCPTNLFMMFSPNFIFFSQDCVNFVAKNFLTETACYPKCILFLFPLKYIFVSGFLFHLILLSSLISQYDCLLAF